MSTDADEALLMQQLRDLQSEFNGPPVHSEPAPNADTPSDVILTKLQRQTTAIEALNGGLDQMQRQIADRVVEAIRQSDLLLSTASPQAPEPSLEAPKPSQEAPEPVGSTADDHVVEADEPLEHQSSEASTAPPDNSWDSIRQSFLASTDDAVVEESPEPSDPPVAETEIRAAEVTEPPDDPPEPLKFDVPEPFDCSGIEDDALRAVFLEREEILRLLSLHLLQRPQPPAVLTIEQLREMADSLPEDLRQRVETSLSRLDEQHRLTELELSLERARMARQKTSLEETRCRLENTARQMGYVMRDDGTLEELPEGQEASGTGRRWTRVLGFGR